jgi:hypothetical protein
MRIDFTQKIGHAGDRDSEIFFVLGPRPGAAIEWAGD